MATMSPSADDGIAMYVRGCIRITFFVHGSVSHGISTMVTARRVEVLGYVSNDMMHLAVGRGCFP